MKKSIKIFFSLTAFIFISSIASAQYKMDGNTLVNSSNGNVGKIESDGKTIDDASNNTLSRVDGKTINDSHNNTVLRIDGDVINDSHNSTVGHMSDVTAAISGAKAEPAYVALWWFIVKGNK
ncbi:MAG: 5-fold beta-flower protein [Bacteroidia bacterium]